MNKCSILVLLALSVCLPDSKGGEIEIFDIGSGKVVGKLDPATSRRVSIRGKQYGVRPAVPAAEKTARVVRIPGIELNGTRLEDAVEFLDSMGMEAEGWKKSFSISLAARYLRDRKVVLNMQDSTYHEVLSALAKVAGCEVVYGSDWIVIVESPLR